MNQSSFTGVKFPVTTYSPAPTYVRAPHIVLRHRAIDQMLLVQEANDHYDY